MSVDRENTSETVRLRKGLVRRLRFLAAHHDVTIGEFIARILEPVVDAQFPLILERELHKLRSAPKKKKE